MKVTLSVIKADIGGCAGRSESHQDFIAKAEEMEDTTMPQVYDASGGREIAGQVC